MIGKNDSQRLQMKNNNNIKQQKNDKNCYFPIIIIITVTIIITIIDVFVKNIKENDNKYKYISLTNMCTLKKSYIN